jgi:hypothetical protein
MSSAIRREDVFPVFLSILEVNGFTAVKAGDIYKIVRTETARERAIQTFTHPPPRPMSGLTSARHPSRRHPIIP